MAQNDKPIRTAMNYSDDLGTWVKARRSARQDKNLVAFLAIQDDLKAALDTGYTVKAVWANLHESGRTDLGYESFLRYVNRMIRNEQADAADSATPPPSSPTAPAADQTAPAARDKSRSAVSARPAIPTGFVFDATPRKEDLI